MVDRDLIAARAAGLRNVVAHAYGRADAHRVFAGASEGLEDLERFATEVARWIEERAEPGS